jgi:hypothetical protein
VLAKQVRDLPGIMPREGLVTKADGRGSNPVHGSCGGGHLNGKRTASPMRVPCGGGPATKRKWLTPARSTSLVR